LMWAAIGGAPGVLAHRAVNTLDAMVGHHSARYEHFGWATARLDDFANWLPARLSAASTAALHPSRARHILAVVRRDASQHPSPNGGVIESAFAAALGITLGGTNRYADYVEARGLLGSGRPAATSDIAAAVKLARHINLLCALMFSAAVSAGSALARRRRTR
jgi:adenosylcobinamide-phosphate synthase